MLGEVSEADKHKDKIDRELRGSPASLVEWVILAYVAGQLLLFYPLPPFTFYPPPPPPPAYPVPPLSFLSWVVFRASPVANFVPVHLTSESHSHLGMRREKGEIKS